MRPHAVPLWPALAAALVALAASAAAQTVQLAPFAGYGFGGSLTSADDGQKYTIKSAFAYGGTVDFRISPGWRFERFAWCSIG